MPAADKFQIKGYEKKILSQEQKIEKLEKKIEEEETKILRFQRKIMGGMGFFKAVSHGVNKYQAQVLRIGFLRKLSRRKMLYSALILVGVVLVWRGVWHLADVTPWIANPLVSVFVGFGILWGINRYSRLID